MTGTCIGMMEWSLKRDETGYRTYRSLWRVITDDVNDGPEVVLSASGLPALGDPWVYGNDVDDWVWCRPECNITPVTKREIDYSWDVELFHSNLPLKRCGDSSIDNPLDEPFDISGTFITRTVEASVNKDGNPLVYSNMEQIRGSAAERDDSNGSVHIGFNVLTFDLSLYTQMRNTVNDSTLWGMNPRCIRFVNCPFQRLLYGTCTFYYHVDLEFFVDFNTVDRKVLDIGTKVLAPGGTSSNPMHYQNYRNQSDNEKSQIILDGSGNAWNGSGSPGTRTIQLYTEANLLLLGIPSSL